MTHIDDIRSAILDAAGAKLCIIVGDPVGHSLSPAMHNAAYAACGLAAQFRYNAMHVAQGELAGCVAQVRALGVRGLTCTIPHKSDILAHLDHVDPAVAAIGAANTIVQESDGRLCGYNTDWLGVVEPLAEVVEIAGKRVAVVGAGGTARAAIYGLQERGVSEVLIFNRTLSRAQQLAQEFGETGPCPVSAHGLEAVGPLVQGCDIIVQTTSVGMVPDIDRSPLPVSCWHPGQVVLEAIYKPFRTKLLKEAAAAGAQVIPGVAMLLAQGVAQFALYTEVKAPSDAMKDVLCAQLGIKPW